MQAAPARVNPEHTAPAAAPRGFGAVWLAAVLVAGPFVAATLLVLVFAAMETRGRAPFVDPPPRNMAEAAGLGNAAEVLRMLRRGSNPAAVVEIPADVISPAVRRVTALEAAVWSRRVQLVRLLEREQAIRDDATRAHLACLAVDLRVAEIVEHFPRRFTSRCEPGVTARRIEARTEQASR
jgi:hypothetical protein